MMMMMLKRCIKPLAMAMLDVAALYCSAFMLVEYNKYPIWVAILSMIVAIICLHDISMIYINSSDRNLLKGIADLVDLSYMYTVVESDDVTADEAKESYYPERFIAISKDTSFQHLINQMNSLKIAAHLGTRMLDEIYLAPKTNDNCRIISDLTSDEYVDHNTYKFNDNDYVDVSLKVRDLSRGMTGKYTAQYGCAKDLSGDTDDLSKYKVHLFEVESGSLVKYRWEVR